MERLEPEFPDWQPEALPPEEQQALEALVAGEGPFEHPDPAKVEELLKEAEEAADAAITESDTQSEIRALLNRIEALEDEVTRLRAAQPMGAEDPPKLLPIENVLYGKPTAAFTSGATITLDPCDSAGTDTGEANVIVYVSVTGTTTLHEFETSDVLSYLPFDKAKVVGSDTIVGVLVGMFPGTATSPHALYSTYEGSETAQLDVWNRDTQPVDDGCIVYVTTRVLYNETSAAIVYGFYRALKFDSAGKLVSASGETRYTIDVPEACPAA